MKKKSIGVTLSVSLPNSSMSTLMHFGDMNIVEKKNRRLYIASTFFIGFKGVKLETRKFTGVEKDAKKWALLHKDFDKSD